MTLEAGIFDLDGVVTDTAKIHFVAWKQMFDRHLQQLAQRNKQPFREFTERDYLEYVDGKPRADGIHSFFYARHIQNSEETIEDLAQEKQDLFLKLLGKMPIPLFQSTIDFVHQLRDNNIQTAIVSSSKNCKTILEKAKITDLFSVRVDGSVLKKLGMQGKPAPDMFLEAVRHLQVAPANAFVVEDAIVGVQAARAGGFGLIIGVDRQGSRKDLFRENGADIVVTDLNELALEAIVAQMKAYQP